MSGKEILHRANRMSATVQFYVEHGDDGLAGLSARVFAARTFERVAAAVSAAKQSLGSTGSAWDDLYTPELREATARTIVAEDMTVSHYTIDSILDRSIDGIYVGERAGAA